MRRSDLPSRAPGLAAATTLVALVAMAAACPGARGHGALRGAGTEVALARGDGQAVRAVAAVVAAAARDLLAGSTMSATLPLSAAPPALSAPVVVVVAPVERSRGPASPPLPPRLLDLPPPC